MNHKKYVEDTIRKNPSDYIPYDHEIGFIKEIISYHCEYTQEYELLIRYKGRPWTIYTSDESNSSLRKKVDYCLYTIRKVIRRNYK